VSDTSDLARGDTLGCTRPDGTLAEVIAKLASGDSDKRYALHRFAFGVAAVHPPE
jgi:hypothetical protein